MVGAPGLAAISKREGGGGCTWARCKSESASAEAGTEVGALGLAAFSKRQGGCLQSASAKAEAGADARPAESTWRLRLAPRACKKALRIPTVQAMTGPLPW